MDNGLVTASFTLIGVLAGSAGTYFAPLQAEKRRQRREHAVRMESRADAQLGRYVSARTTVDMWIDLLDRTRDDLEDECPDLEAIEAACVQHSDQLRAQLADLIHLGLPVNGRGGTDRYASDGISAELRYATAQAKMALRRPADERAPALAKLRRAIVACRTERNEWAAQVLDAVADLPGARPAPTRRA